MDEELRYIKLVQSSEDALASKRVPEDTSRHLPSGWFIAPSLVLAVFLWGFAIYGMMKFFGP